MISNLFFFWFFFGDHTQQCSGFAPGSVLMNYSWAVVRGPYMASDIKLYLALCKVSTLFLYYLSIPNSLSLFHLTNTNLPQYKVYS